MSKEYLVIQISAVKADILDLTNRIARYHGEGPKCPLDVLCRAKLASVETLVVLEKAMKELEKE